ncbi:ATP-binding protein [Streptomyces minutiscleroticus]|uniref:ATP-binding protein n=1 Tax=Streptomyces minutiscleroticus TaxID=68238 RepID=A0A918KAR6_9ACTN|nr:ATP-binding protein [Streptomyces minutiscleroticus]GGX57209.1 ATP-binding protein [Streptomyces minutiscleroticus]
MIDLIDTEGDRAEWTFPADPRAVRTARSLVRGRLREWGLEALDDMAELLVSEVMTNALRHAYGPVVVCLVRPGGPLDALRVEVSDPLPDLPRARPVRPEDESGRGLHLVACSSRAWGARPKETGKTVWFELAVPDRAHGA